MSGSLLCAPGSRKAPCSRAVALKGRNGPFVKHQGLSDDLLVNRNFQQILRDLEACRKAFSRLSDQANAGAGEGVGEDATRLALLITQHRLAYESLVQSFRPDQRLAEVDVSFSHLLLDIDAFRARAAGLSKLHAADAALSRELEARSRRTLKQSWHALSTTAAHPSAAASVFADSTRPPAAALIRKLQGYGELAAAEQEVLTNIIGRPQEAARGEDIVRHGQEEEHCTLLVDGLCASYTDLENGQRQITALHVPGDFLDLQSLAIKAADPGVLALTPVRVAKLSQPVLLQASAAHPRLARLIWLANLVEAATYRRWLLAMGRMTSVGHTGHLFCELYTRLHAVGLAKDHAFPFPVGQNSLADILGLSAVHVNRTLQQLRADRLIEWQGATLRILDWARLADFSHFDPGYLQPTVKRF